MSPLKLVQPAKKWSPQPVQVPHSASLAASAQPAGSQKTVSLRLNWYIGGLHAPFYLGKERGYYAQNGVNLNIGEGEVQWDVFFRTLAEMRFNGILTNSVFAWEDRAVESSRFMRERIQCYLERFFC